MLKTGDILQITFRKKIDISDTEEYWIGENAAGERFLIDAIAYQHYHFAVNKQATAVVDHINCSGKIFLEPEHPVYKSGKKYLFPVQTIIRQNAETTEIVVEDIFKNAIQVEVNSKNINTGLSEIELTVARVRKAIPVLFDATLKLANLYREHKIYSFHVDSSINHGGDDFFVLSGKAGSAHLLPKKFFSHYSISEGQVLKCEVTRVAQNGKLSLEPLHPSLRKGDVVELQFAELANPESSPAGKHKLYRFIDDDGHDFFMSARFIDDKPLPEKMLCKIDKFKKGAILVEPV